MQVIDLGHKDYWPTYGFQRGLVDAKIAGHADDYLVMVEHPHTYTTGRGGERANIPRGNVPVFRVDRGGDITYHGPGQLVVYPIVDLARRGRDIDAYLRVLEAAVSKALAAFGLTSHIRPGYTGVWTTGGKIASIGIGVRKWITFHGFAVNVDPDLAFFKRIAPCGLSDIAMTSIKKESGKPVPMEEVKRELAHTVRSILTG